MFLEDSEDQMILGIPFMRGYYVTHNLDELTFGIVPHIGSTKSKGIAGV